MQTEKWGTFRWLRHRILGCPVARYATRPNQLASRGMGTCPTCGMHWEHGYQETP